MNLHYCALCHSLAPRDHHNDIAPASSEFPAEEHTACPATGLREYWVRGGWNWERRAGCQDLAETTFECEH